MKISVIIPAFNAAAFIGATLESIRAQQDPDCEVIVMDGGSADGTSEVVAAYADVVTRFISEKDGGQSDAINKGFALATGEVMAWLCADDLYLPGALRRVRDYFTAHPDHDFVYGDGIRIDVDGRKISDIISGPVLDYANFENYNYVFSTTAFWTRRLWMAAGGRVDEANHWTMDWELFIRMSRQAKLHYASGMVAALRTHDGAKTSTGMASFKAKRDREIVQVSRRHGGWFCFNSLIYPAIWLTNLARHFDGLPRPLYRLAFAASHLPMRWVPADRHTIFFNGKKPR